MQNVKTDCITCPATLYHPPEADGPNYYKCMEIENFTLHKYHTGNHYILEKDGYVVATCVKWDELPDVCRIIEKLIEKSQAGLTTESPVVDTTATEIHSPVHLN